MIAFAQNDGLYDPNTLRKRRSDRRAYGLHRVLRISEIKNLGIVSFPDIDEPAVPAQVR